MAPWLSALCRPCRGALLWFQHTHSCSQTSVTPVPEDLMSYSVPPGRQARTWRTYIHICKQNMPIHKNKKKLNAFTKDFVVQQCHLLHTIEIQKIVRVSYILFWDRVFSCSLGYPGTPRAQLPLPPQPWDQRCVLLSRCCFVCFNGLLFFFFSSFLRWGLMQPRLTSNSLCSQGCPRNFDSLASRPQVLGLQVSHHGLVI